MSQENDVILENRSDLVPGRGAAPPFFRLTCEPRTRLTSTKGTSRRLSSVPVDDRLPTVRSAQRARSNNDVG
jgi:hypothetical protein